MPTKTTFVRLRVEASERERWKEAASARGRSLSTLIRDAIEAALAAPVVTPEEELVIARLSPLTEPARTKPATLEDRLAALSGLVDGLALTRSESAPMKGTSRAVVG